MKRIESPKNPYIKQLKKLHTKKERDKTGTFLVEGWHLTEEALKSGNEVVALIVRDGEDIPSKWDVSSLDIIHVTSEVMNAISDTEHPQGIAAVCSFPEETEQQQAGKVLMIDGVQDPGNLGTLIRTADSAGIDLVILGNGTVDLYNSKVIRSSQGSIFHLPIRKGSLADWITTLQKRGIPVFGTALQNSTPFDEVTPEETFALIVGNEGNGMDRELLARTDRNLFVPIYGKAESLNVSIAAGILLYHLRKR